MGFFRFAGLAITLIAVLVACPEPTKPPTLSAPKITAFTATPNALTKAGTVTLEWTVTDATSLSISPSVGAVTGSSKTLNVSATTTFEFTAQNTVGTDKKSVLVTVNVNPTTLTQADQWTAPIPSNTQMVTTEVFQQRLNNGELSLLSPKQIQSQTDVRMQTYQADLTALQGISSPSPALTAFLSEAAQNTNPDVSPSAELPGGRRVLLNGAATQARSLREALEKGNSPTEALANYNTLYNLLSENQKTQVAAPGSLAGGSLEQIQIALTALNTLLGTVPNLGRTRVETNVLRPQALVAGNGSDNDGMCSPRQLFAKYWFPLKNFVSPVKQQGQRGLCWAFSAVGALESRERVQNGTTPDLSEQFLANKVRGSWERADFTDGYFSELALQKMISNNQVLPPESFWTYNPAYGRNNSAPEESGSTPTRPRFVNSCTDINPRSDITTAYNGTCYDTSHQSNTVCTMATFGLYCASEAVNYSGVGVAASDTIYAWTSGQPLLLNNLEGFLAAGYTLMASFPVYTGFMDTATNGFVIDDRRFKLENGQEVEGNYGGHVVQIVGFLRNGTFSTNDAPNAAGGGYFIAKNSWGCAVGDSGYYYIPADYIAKHFYSLSLLAFDGRRSSAWQATQHPAVQAKAAANKVDLRVPIDLANLFSLTHPTIKNTNIVIRDSSNTVLYNGGWQLDALIPAVIPYTFTRAGIQTLKITTQVFGQELSSNLDVNVVNTAPIANLAFPTPLYSYSSSLPTPLFTATIKDINEANPQALCANLRWEVDLPDLIESDTITNVVTGGCRQKIRFAASGSREIRVLATDSDGLTNESRVSLTVLEPPVNPNPIILGGGVKNWDVAGSFGTCLSLIPRPQGSTIDLSVLPTETMGCNGLPNPRTLQGYVNLQNPDNEPLLYYWRLTLNTPNGIYPNPNDPPVQSMQSTAVDFSIPTVIFGSGGTYSCQVTLEVTPVNDSSRFKFQQVWSGQCLVAAAVPK